MKSLFKHSRLIQKDIDHTNKKVSKMISENKKLTKELSKVKKELKEKS